MSVRRSVSVRAATVSVGWDGTRAAPLALPIVSGACLAGAACYVAAVEPGTSGGLGACPIRAATGVWCPGCGLTRATHHLLRGNVTEAFAHHLFVPFVLAGVVALWWTWVRIAAGAGVPRRIAAIRPRAYVLAGAVFATFTVARNLPTLEVLRGGP